MTAGASLPELNAPEPSPEETIMVLAPYGRDADVTVRVLTRWGIHARRCMSTAALCDAVHHGYGALLVTEEALTLDGRAKLLGALQSQEPWSDVPVVLLTMPNPDSGDRDVALGALAERTSLTVLERPVRLATLVSTLRSALRARRRQFDVRDHLEERARHEQHLRENERRLKEARALAEEANLAKTRFLATMSHELRTPLNAIAGYTEILSMGVHGPITEQQQADLSRIERSQKYLLSLINDVLNYSKIEAGHVAFAKRPFDIDPLIRSLHAFVQPQMQSKQVRYEYHPEATHCLVLADEDKTQQVILNLLSNALKFTPTGGEVTITCRNDDRQVMVVVKDTGMGIPPDKHESIFEPFVQLGRDLTSGGEGTGLGLSISRDLARNMGGELRVESESGKGATFILTLPRALDVDRSPVTAAP
ncbi:MAG TPA: ATP-binding protein [Gemmatimonadaceae bacterium]|nr:ATP-binding protein [Gemmatimonadaceae bacterium]